MISKKQIILIGSAACIVAVLLSFPIGVIKKEKKKDNTTVQKSDTSEASQSGSHSVEIATELQNEVDSLKKLLKQSNTAAVAEKIGDIFSSATAFDSAIYYYNQASKIKDNLSIKIKTSEAYYNLFGITEGKNARVAEECERILKDIITISPSNLDARARLGYVITLNSETPMEGVGMLNEVLKEDPRHRLGLFNLGLLAIRSGQMDKAITRFETILKLDPNDQVSRFYLAICYKETNNLVKTRELVSIIAKSNADPVLISEANKLLVE